LHRHVLLPAFETGLKRRKVFRYLRELEQSQWLSTSELEARQLDLISTLARHAGTMCPYYAERWAHLRIDPKQIESWDDFRRLPVIERETVRENRLRMRSTAPNARLLSKSTGGSTGVPLHFDYDDGSLDRRFANWHRGYTWAGAALGTKQFYFWGVPLGARKWTQRVKDALYNRLYRRLVVSSFDFKEEFTEDVLRRYNSYRPDVIVAYTNPLYYLARALEAQGHVPRQPKSIIVGAEKLYSFQREQIERVFRCPVFETYGTREFMLLGAECDRHRGLHLSMENCLVEVLDDNGRPCPSGTEGNVVVTDLTNYGMPFIRYANGDRALAGWDTCTCGRGLPLLTGIVGRQLDVIRTPDGRMVPGEFFPHLLKDYPSIRRFQVVQVSRISLELRLVVNQLWRAGDQRTLENVVREMLGPMMKIEVIRLDHIPVLPSGKFRVVIGLDDAETNLCQTTVPDRKQVLEAARTL
jgi:phenylacetate-CoA ligase